MPFTISLNEEEAKHLFEVELGAHHGAASRLAKEGISRPEELIELVPLSIKTIAGSLRWPGGRVPDEAIKGRAMPTKPLEISAKSVTHLENDAGATKCYEALKFQATTGVLAHEPGIKNFKLEHNALVEIKSLTASTTHMPNNLGADKLKEALLDLLSRLK